MSNSAFVPFRVGEQLLLGAVVTLLLMSILFAGVVWSTIASGVRPSGGEVRTLLTFGSFMLAAVGTVRPLARRFDIRHSVRFERARTVAVDAAGAVRRKVRAVGLLLRR